MNKNEKYKASTKSVIRLSSRHCKVFVLTASSLQGLQLFRAILWHVLARRTFPVHRPIWSLAALVCAGGRYIGHRKRLQAMSPSVWRMRRYSPGIFPFAGPCLANPALNLKPVHLVFNLMRYSTDPVSPWLQHLGLL